LTNLGDIWYRRYLRNAVVEQIYAVKVSVLNLYFT